MPPHQFRGRPPPRNSFIQGNVGGYNHRSAPPHAARFQLDIPQKPLSNSTLHGSYRPRHNVQSRDADPSYSRHISSNQPRVSVNSDVQRRHQAQNPDNRHSPKSNASDQFKRKDEQDNSGNHETLEIEYNHGLNHDR